MEQIGSDNINKRLSKVEEICDRMEKHVTKIFEVVVGDESFGQVGLIQRLVKLEKEAESLKAFKNKLIGGAIFGGAISSILFEVIKLYLKK
jgi:hypothetical protein